MGDLTMQARERVAATLELAAKKLRDPEVQVLECSECDLHADIWTRPSDDGMYEVVVFNGHTTYKLPTLEFYDPRRDGRPG